MYYVLINGFKGGFWWGGGAGGEGEEVCRLWHGVVE